MVLNLRSSHSEVAPSHQPCPVNQWVVQNSESGAPCHGKLSPGVAVARPSQNYADSIMSSVASPHGISIHSALRKLQRAVVKMKLIEGKGEKQIAHDRKVCLIVPQS